MPASTIFLFVNREPSQYVSCTSLLRRHKQQHLFCRPDGFAVAGRKMPFCTCVCRTSDKSRVLGARMREWEATHMRRAYRPQSVAAERECFVVETIAARLSSFFSAKIRAVAVATAVVLQKHTKSPKQFVLMQPVERARALLSEVDATAERLPLLMPSPATSLTVDAFLFDKRQIPVRPKYQPFSSHPSSETRAIVWLQNFQRVGFFVGNETHVDMRDSVFFVLFRKSLKSNKTWTGTRWWKGTPRISSPRSTRYVCEGEPEPSCRFRCHGPLWGDTNT